MWWKIRKLWLGASIRTKIKIYALAVILVMGLSAGISVQITGFGLDSFNQILYDNSKCNNFHEALTEETDCFTRYARERSKDNREAYEKACEKTARCLNQLPFDYASIGSERYADDQEQLYELPESQRCFFENGSGYLRVYSRTV